MPSFLDPDHLHAFAISLLRLGAWLLLLAIVFLPLERLFAIRPRRIIAKNLPGDLGFFLISGLLPSLLLTPPLALVGLAAHTLVPDALPAAVAALPLWLRGDSKKDARNLLWNKNGSGLSKFRRGLLQRRTGPQCYWMLRRRSVPISA